MADDQPGRSDDINIAAREYLEKLVRGGQRLLIFLHAVKIIRSRPEDDRRLFVFREGIGKLQRAADNLPPDRIFVLRRSSTKLLPVRGDRREAGMGGFFVGRVAICGLFEFRGCGAERLIF